MRRPTLAILGATLVLGLSSCHLQDRWPYDRGTVIGKNIDLTNCPPLPGCAEYELRLEKIVPHGVARGWQPVDQTTFNRCNFGEQWNEDVAGGCPAGIPNGE